LIFYLFYNLFSEIVKLLAPFIVVILFDKLAKPALETVAVYETPLDKPSKITWPDGVHSEVKVKEISDNVGV
jgi:hypothetical protein